MPSPAPPQELADGKLLVDRPTDHVARLTITNPAKRNALGPADHRRDRRRARRSLPSEGWRALRDRDRRPRDVLRGIRHRRDRRRRFREEAEGLVAHPFTEAIEALESYPYPTLAVLPGHTIGGGLELALACDLRVASREIKLGMPPAKLGLVYSHTGLRRFIDAIGAARTRELFLLGSYIDADTASRWGLRQPRGGGSGAGDRTALEVADELAGNAPLSQRGNKRVIAALLRARGRLTEDVEVELIELRRASFDSHDLREGMSAFVEKRPPRWRGE